MDIKGWLGAIELFAVFGLFMFLCWRQIRHLDKLDEQDAKREAESNSKSPKQDIEKEG